MHAEHPGQQDNEIVRCNPSVLPTVVSRPRGMIVLAKPVNWEVDGLSSEGGGALLLSYFVQSILPRSTSELVYTAELDYGFIHRLDVPSSGLILGGTSFEGLFHLKWQIAVYSIERQYFTANHGHLGVNYLDVDKSVDATTVENMRSLTDDAGKPAKTRFRLLGHLYHQRRNTNASLAHDEEHHACGFADLCLLGISIYTGRRHQIRTHTRYAGHPCVTDGRYTPRDIVVQQPLSNP